MTTLTDLLTRDAFRAWLESQPEGAIIGRRSQSDDCPAARFLLDAGYSAVSVSPTSIAAGAHDACETEQWLEDFIRRIDDFDRERSLSVTREEALAALEEVER